MVKEKINFSCEKVDFKDIIKCNYGLNETQYLVFELLLKSNKGLSVKDIIEYTKKDRTTIQKILIKLYQDKIVFKRQMNLDRGFMFVYFLNDRNKLIDEIEENINSYYTKLKDKLNQFRGDIHIK